MLIFFDFEEVLESLLQPYRASAPLDNFLMNEDMSALVG